MRTYDFLVAAGTTKAREAILELLDHGYSIIACVATDLGEAVLQDVQNEGLKVCVGRKDEIGFMNIIRTYQIKKVIDATHPFAVEVTKTLKKICREIWPDGDSNYIRFVRETMNYSYEKVIWADDASMAAEILTDLPGNFLLTTGANTVDQYVKRISSFNERGFVRVLNTKTSIDRCIECGIDMERIIAKNPPFSKEDNDRLISQYQIQAIVSKDSGMIGGLNEKIASAKDFQIPIILIKRPESERGISTIPELLDMIKQ